MYEQSLTEERAIGTFDPDFGDISFVNTFVGVLNFIITMIATYIETCL